MAALRRTIHFQGYRSLRDFRMRLGRLTVVTGGNGVGKSNVYRALGLMRKIEILPPENPIWNGTAK